MLKNFGVQVTSFYKSLRFDASLPPGVEVMNPFSEKVVFGIIKTFYEKYFADTNKRVFIFGINPGRFGGGITGIPFTDPVKLEQFCGIPNPFQKRAETSSDFIYKVIERWGGAEKFYSSFYVTAISPLGFTKNGINFNYYDDKKIILKVEPFIVSSIIRQLKFPCNKEQAVCIGMGKNLDFFNRQNDKHSFFKKIIPLPHPRFIMQYRRKYIDEHIDEYLSVLNSCLK